MKWAFSTTKCLCRSAPVTFENNWTFTTTLSLCNNALLICAFTGLLVQQNVYVAVPLFHITFIYIPLNTYIVNHMNQVL